MIQFENLKVEGFCSIEKLEINLNQKGTTIITGPNGAGKSNWFSSIVWALYGKNLKGVSDVNTWPKLRSKDYAGTMVSIHWNHNGSIYQVIRCQNYKGKIFGAKGVSRLILVKNAEPVIQKRKDEIQEMVIDLIGMSYKLFMTSIMFGQGLNRLIDKSNSDKKSIFEEIFDLQYISMAQSSAKSTFNTLNNELQQKQSELKGLETSILTLEESLQDEATLVKKFGKINKQKIQELTSEIADTKLVIKQIKGKQTEEYVDLSKKRERLNQYKREIGAVNRNISDKTLDAVIDSTISLLESGKVKKALTELKFIKENHVNLQDLKDKHSKLLTSINKIQTVNHRVERTNSIIESHQKTIKQLQKRIDDINQQVKPSTNPTLRKKLNGLNEEFTRLKRKAKILHEKVENYRWLYTEPLGPNGLKAYIFENSIDELNKILLEYSDILGIHIYFLMDTSSTRKEFETIIKLEGNTILFEELSGGQKQLVHLAMALAMNKVVCNAHEINIALLDEVFESLSQDNIEIVVGLLKKVYKNNNLFLITHHNSLPLGNSRVISVNKHRGISQYKF